MKKDIDKNINQDNLVDDTQTNLETTEAIKIKKQDEDNSGVDLEIYKEEYDTDKVLEMLEKISTSDEENKSDESVQEAFKLFDETEEAKEDIKKPKKKNDNSIVIKSVVASSIVSIAISGGALYFAKENLNPTSTTTITIKDYETDNVYKAVAAKASPSVVGITTITENIMFPWYGVVESEGIGTGVVVNEDGYILTNSHVVNDGDVKKVTALFNDSTVVEGEVVWNDTTLDLALIKVEKEGLVVADLGDSDELEVGDLAIAIGNPLDLKYNTTVTQGIISGLNRAITLESGEMTDLIQTDASINPGNSGGPLLNANGEVVGINTAKASDAEGVGFSIPINVAKPIIESVIENGDFERVTLGIRGYDVSELSSQVEISRENGVFVFEVESDTPAKQAGITTGDIIIAIGDKQVTNMSDLTKILYSYKEGDKTTVTIYKDGEEKKIEVQF